jgi:Ni/Co efflux regulator RcnB
MLSKGKNTHRVSRSCSSNLLFFITKGEYMNKKTISSVLIAVFMAASMSSAFAQGRGNDKGGNDRQDNDRGRGQQSQDHKRPDHQNYRDNGRNDRQNYQARGNDSRYKGRGAGPRHDMRRGGRLSNEYRGNQYVVNDWRAHRLSAPPRGSHWVQTGGDYVLVTIASGIIAQILLSN